MLTENQALATQQSRSQPVSHGNEIAVGNLGSVRINYTIIKIDIMPFQDASFINAKTGVNHQDEDVSCCLPAFLMLRVLHCGGISFFDNSLLFVVGQITEGLVLDIPLTPFGVGNLIDEAIGMPADVVELPGPHADSDILNAAFALIFNPPG